MKTDGSSVKLYFMLGLPTETDEDVLGIADLAEKVRRCYFSVPKEKRAPGLRITVSAIRVRSEEFYAVSVDLRSWMYEFVLCAASSF